MDALEPLVVTAQDPSGLRSSQDSDSQFPPCTSAPTASQQLRPPAADPESPPCCLGSAAGQMARSSGLSSVGREGHEDCSCRKKNKGVENTGEEAGPALTVDSGPVSDPSSCLSGCGGKGAEGPPPCGIGHEETGTIPAAVAPDQESLSSAATVLPGGMALEPGTAPHFSGGDLAVSSTADASVPEDTGEAEYSVMKPRASTQQPVPEAGMGTRNSSVSAAGASDGKGPRKPGGKASVPSCVSAVRSLAADWPADRPAGSVLAFSNGETSVEKAAETETSRSCKESAGAPVGQDPVLIPAVVKDKISDGFESDAPLANTREEVPPSDLTCPRPQKAVPNQNSDTDSSHVQSPNSRLPICPVAGDDGLRAASACPQSTVTSSGVLAARHHGVAVAPPAAVRPEGPQADAATPDPVKLTQEDVGFCSLGISDEEGQGRDLELEKSLTNVLMVAPHPHTIVPKAQKETGPDQVVASGRTFSLATSPGSESVTRDDALSLVPSQKEKGTAAPEPHPTADSEDGRGADGPDEQPLGNTPCAALALQPGMGNTSPLGFGGEQEGPHLSAAPEVLNAEAGTDSSLLHVGKAPLASDSSLTEEGKRPVVLESSAVEGQDGKPKAVIRSSVKDDALSSGMVQREQRTAPSGQEAPGVRGEPSSAACAEDKAHIHDASRGTPSACPNAETKHNKEVAPPVSLLTEGGAACSPVPPGASLAADSSQEAVGAERGSSPLPPGLPPDGSEALNCNGSSPLDVGVKSTLPQGKSTAWELGGDAPVDVPVVNAPQGTAGPRGKDLSCNAQDLPTPEVLLSQERTPILGLPGAAPNKGVTDLQGAAPPEMVPLGWEKRRLEGADHSCGMGDCEAAQTDDDACHVPLQTVAKELLAETGMSPSDDKAPSRDQGGPPPPYTVSAKTGHLPERADTIEEAASRIVDAVIEQVRASGALLTEGEISHMSPSSPSELGPVTKQLESASVEKGIAFPTRETPQMGSIHDEVPGNLAGRSAGREEPEKIVQPVPGPEPTAGEQSRAQD